MRREAWLRRKGKQIDLCSKNIETSPGSRKHNFHATLKALANSAVHTAQKKREAKLLLAISFIYSVLIPSVGKRNVLSFAESQRGERKISFCKRIASSINPDR